MNGLLFIIISTATTFASISALAENTYRPKTEHTYISGPRGGCYYINRNGNKTYVDRALCNPSTTKINNNKKQ